MNACIATIHSRASQRHGQRCGRPAISASGRYCGFHDPLGGVAAGIRKGWATKRAAMGEVMRVERLAGRMVLSLRRKPTIREMRHVVAAMRAELVSCKAAVLVVQSEGA